MTAHDQMYLERSNWDAWQRSIIRTLQTEGLSCWINKEKWPDFAKILTDIDRYRLQQHKEKAVAILKQYLTPEVEPLVEDLEEPDEIWNTLKVNLEVSGRAPKAYLFLEYENVKITPDEDIPSFITRLDAANKRLSEVGEKIPETQRIYKLLQNIPEEFDYLLREFDRLADDKYSYSHIRAELIKEVNRKELREKQRNEVYLAGSSKEKDSTKQSKAPQEKPILKCRKCNRRGHEERNCRSNTKDATFVTELLNANCFSTEIMPPTFDWTLDSASTAHICQNRLFFVSIRQPPQNMIVRMGTTPHPVRGIGSVKFYVNDQGRCKQVQMKEVLYVPSIHRNLISMSRMDRAGFHAKMDRGFKIFNKNWKYLYTAHMVKQFYILKAVQPIREDQGETDVKKSAKGTSNEDKTEQGKTSSKVNEAFSSDDLKLWHERFGHFNQQYVQKMFKERLVEPAKNLRGKPQNCESCRLGKGTKQSHPALPDIRSKGLLELVHCDLWGPSPVKSRNQHRFLLTCIDDFSRRAFCYPLRSKDQTMTNLVNFINFAERQTGKKVKVLRTDNGLEFCNSPIGKYLTEHGIKHERTSISSPQMNGCAERYNRVLFEGVRTLQIASNLPSNLWTEIVMTVNYIRNRVWHSTIDGIPFTKWYNKKPTIRHLKRYGCVAYVHIPKDRRTSKFQPRAKKGVLVGYGIGTAGYRIWIPQENVILESKHVVFDEDRLGRPINGGKSALNLDDDTLVSFQIPQPAEIPKEEEATTSTKTTQEEIEEQEGTGINDKESSGESVLNRLDPGKVEFLRLQVTRQKGASKGRIDTYFKAPTGETLRSNKELQEYCKLHSIRYDRSKANFDHTNNFEGALYLDKIEDEVMCTEVLIPKSPKQAKTLPESAFWQEAMNKEIQTMIDRDVWTPVPNYEGHKIIGTRWVFTIKRDAENKISSYKARLVALGNQQKEGLDFEETFSPVINFTLIRMFTVLFTCILKWVNCLLDVKCAYLYGDIDREIYIRQPDDFLIKGKENYVLKLKKSIYGLHQSGRCWYHDLREKLLNNGFKEIEGVTCAYSFSNCAIILIYVDDLPIFAKDRETLDKVINIIKNIYDVKELGEITQLLGVKFEKQEDTLYNLNCEQYIDKCARKFNVKNSHTSLPFPPGYQPEPATDDEVAQCPEVNYRSLLGSLLYISQRCRPDISWITTAMAQFTERHSGRHYQDLMRILQYLVSTPKLGLIYQESKEPIQISCYSDASWCSTIPDRRSWSSYLVQMNGMPISWRVKKQAKVSASPMESEYISAAEATKELIYLSTILTQINKAVKLNFQIQTPILHIDNSAAITFITKRTANVKTRYISLDYNFVKCYYEEKLFDIMKVDSKENLADILTKAVPRDLFLKLRTLILH